MLLSFYNPPVPGKEKPRCFLHAERPSFLKQAGIFALVLFLFVPFLCLLSADEASGGEQPFRIGFSRSTVNDLNENDAMAATALFAKELVGNKGINVDPKAQIFADSAAIGEALRKRRVESINLTMPEFFKLRPLMSTQHVIVAVRNGSYTEENILLVHRDSHITSLTELAGHSLLIERTPHNALGEIWLDTELGAAGITEPQTYFSKRIPAAKISKAVLPVFFRKTDACLVTKKGFDIMAELNPQLAQQLHIILVSREYVPMVFGFRGDYEPPNMPQILEAITSGGKSAHGRQILTMFQSEGILQLSGNQLETTMSLLEKHLQMFGDNL